MQNVLVMRPDVRRLQPEPSTGEARTSGSAASLAGLEAALESGDAAAEELAIRRIVLLHWLAFAHGGLPLLYMGDELGLRSDPAWAEDPAHAADNRWMHRPPMDWQAAERRHDPGTVEGRIWAGLQRLVAARRGTRAVHAQGRSEPLWTGNPHVFALRRTHAGEQMLLLANFAATEQLVPAGVLPDPVALGPYEFRWIA